MIFFTIKYLPEVLFQNVKYTLNFLFLLFALEFPLKKKSLLKHDPLTDILRFHGECMITSQAVTFWCPHITM